VESDSERAEGKIHWFVGVETLGQVWGEQVKVSSLVQISTNMCCMVYYSSTCTLNYCISYNNIPLDISKAMKGYLYRGSLDFYYQLVIPHNWEEEGEYPLAWCLQLILYKM